MKRRSNQKFSSQVIEKVHKSSKMKRKKKLDGNTEVMISTGSTLLDLAISGTRKRGGGIPGGILVEIFGPSGSGKTVLLCEIAGGVKRHGGDVMFKDPEARLDKQFAKLFDLEVDEIDYKVVNTVSEVFAPVREWEPSSKSEISGVFADSLAALSTTMEMEGEDKMGMKRAKDFSEQLRKTCRIITEKNFLMVCSNQVRQNMDAGQYGQKFISPGGQAIGFYSSLRLRFGGVKKLKKEITYKGRKTKRVYGTETLVEVYKSSVDSPFRTAPLTILFDYGIDDVRANLQFIKDFSKNSFYSFGDSKLSGVMEEAISMIEEGDHENDLREEVIDLWENIEKKFKSERKLKSR